MLTPAPNKTRGKLLIEEIAKSWSWYCLTLLYNMMGNKPLKKVSWILHWNEGHLWDLHPSKKQAPRWPGASPRQPQWELKTGSKEVNCPCPPPCRRTAIIFFSQQHDGRKAQYKKHQRQERHEGGRPGAAGGGGCVHEVLEAAWHLTLGGLVKVDGYIRQEEDQDEVVNVQA